MEHVFPIALVTNLNSKNETEIGELLAENVDTMLDNNANLRADRFDKRLKAVINDYGMPSHGNFSTPRDGMTSRPRPKLYGINRTVINREAKNGGSHQSKMFVGKKDIPSEPDVRAALPDDQFAKRLSKSQINIFFVNRHTRKKGNSHGKGGMLKDAKTDNLRKNGGGGVLVGDGGGGDVPQQKEDYSVQLPVRGMISGDSQDLYQSKCIFRL